MPLLLLFILVPVVEMWVLIEVGSEIGALTTIGLVFLTAIVGLALLRYQGISTLLRANQRMQRGELPATEVAEGIFLAVGGALLLTPGFVTDAFGLACLIPGLRQWLIGLLLKRAVFRAQSGPRPGQAQGDIIEGEYQRQHSSRDALDNLSDITPGHSSDKPSHKP